MLRHSAVSTDTVLTTVSELRFRHQFAPAGGLGACPQVAKRNGFQQCSCTHEPCSRSSLLAYRWPPSRLINMAPLALRTHARTRSRTLLTIERTCPAGASWSLPLGRVSGVERFAYDPADRGFQTLRRLQFPISSGYWCNTRGQLPPARRARGGIYGCRGEAASGLRNAKCARP